VTPSLVDKRGCRFEGPDGAATIELRVPKVLYSLPDPNSNPSPLNHPNVHNPAPSTLTMAAKRNARDVTPSPPINKSGTSTPTTPVPAPAVKSATSKSKDANLSAQEVAVAMWDNYVKATPQRTKLIDVFMAFLVVVGVLQFVYCVIVGNYVSAVQSVWVKGNFTDILLAIQCLSLGVFSHCRTVRLNWYVNLCFGLRLLNTSNAVGSFVKDTDKCREQSRV
jgi:hypothetical protein